LWYESKEVGLGVRFRDEIAHVIERRVVMWFPKCLPKKTLVYLPKAGKFLKLMEDFCFGKKQRPILPIMAMKMVI